MSPFRLHVHSCSVTPSQKLSYPIGWGVGLCSRRWWSAACPSSRTTSRCTSSSPTATSPTVSPTSTIRCVDQKISYPTQKVYTETAYQDCARITCLEAKSGFRSPEGTIRKLAHSFFFSNADGEPLPRALPVRRADRGGGERGGQAVRGGEGGRRGIARHTLVAAGAGLAAAAERAFSAAGGGKKPGPTGGCVHEEDSET